MASARGVRGSGLSFSLVEPHKRDRPKKPDEPDPRHAPRMVSDAVSFPLISIIGHNLDLTARTYLFKTFISIRQSNAECWITMLEPCLLESFAIDPNLTPCAEMKGNSS
jgi:hypothetical protein